MAEAIEVSDEGKRRIIALNRPEKANALTAEMLRSLINAFAESSAHQIVLTGRGKVFSAGADLDEAKAGLATSDLWSELSDAVSNSQALTVAALNGTLAGGASGMALACDIRLAVPNAQFFYPVMRLGFLPPVRDAPRLRALIGPAKASMILMAGQKIDASDALAWGLIDQIVSPDELHQAALQLGDHACNADSQLVSGIKQMISTTAE